MKKITVTFFLLIIILLSFSGNIPASNSTNTPIKNFGTCSAPTGLMGTVSGNSVTLSWTGGPNVSYYSYGGYYNRTGPNPPPNVITFGNTTTATSAVVNLTPTFVSGTFKVTAHCSDGTTSESLPQTF